MSVETTIYRLLCKGCGRKGPASYTRRTAIEAAKVHGWVCEKIVGQEWDDYYCRRCAEEVVNGPHVA